MMINKIWKWITSFNKPKKEVKYLEDLKREMNLKKFELFIDGVPVGYFKNPSRVAAKYKDLHRSKLYYHINKYGTYKDEKYELKCRKS